MGDISSNVGVFNTVGIILSTVGDNLSTVGEVQYRGGYHDTCGGSCQYHGGRTVPQIFMFSIVGRYHNMCVRDIQYLQYSTFFMISPTVPNTPQYSRYPYGTGHSP